MSTGDHIRKRQSVWVNVCVSLLEFLSKGFDCLDDLVLKYSKEYRYGDEDRDDDPVYW